MCNFSFDFCAIAKNNVFLLFVFVLFRNTFALFKLYVCKDTAYCV